MNHNKNTEGETYAKDFFRSISFIEPDPYFRSWTILKSKKGLWSKTGLKSPEEGLPDTVGFLIEQINIFLLHYQ